MACKCISCQECKGSGAVWRAFNGEYLGSTTCDDLDEIETCDECKGTGISEECEECQQKNLELEKEYEEF